VAVPRSSSLPTTAVDALNRSGADHAGPERSHDLTAIVALSDYVAVPGLSEYQLGMLADDLLVVKRQTPECPEVFTRLRMTPTSLPGTASERIVGMFGWPRLGVDGYLSLEEAPFGKMER